MSSPLSRLLMPRSVAPVVTSRLPLGALLQSQWSARRFLRYDLALRTLTARHLLGGGTTRKNVVGWYEMMQQKRAGKDTLDSFRALIGTIEREGLSSHYPVGVSGRGELLDGAHRVAVALAMDAYDIAVDVRAGKRLRPYGRDWFRSNGFPDEALIAMDQEVDRLMATTGADTILVTHSSDDPLPEWVPAFLPPDTEVVRQWSVSLDQQSVVALEGALSFIPWHEKDRQQPTPQLLREGSVEILRLRPHSPRRLRIPKTATAREQGAFEMQRSLRVALPEHPVVIGHTIQQNRDAIALLLGHGWSPAVGETWA